MKELIAQLIRDRRLEENLSSAEVANQAYVSVEELEAFENRRGDITSSALERVASVLGIDPLALREGRIEQSPTATMWFRQEAFADFRDVEDQPKVINALQRAVALCEVNAILGRPPSLRAKFAPEEATPEAFQDGYRLARRVRRELGTVLDSFPDLTSLVEETFDILVCTESLVSTRIDALSFREPKTAAAAVILNAASKRRANSAASRVDLAHELAHILFDPPNGKINLIIDQDDDTNKNAMHGEQRARAFAAELLMPTEGLRQLLGPPNYEMSMESALEMLDRVRRYFDTPIEIAANHLKNRDYIVHFIREAVIEEARQRNIAIATPVVSSISPTPDLLTRRVHVAFDRGLISARRARELLQLSVWDDLPFENT